MNVDLSLVREDIETTQDLLERALKLSGLVTSIFAERGFPLVTVGGSAVEFYTEGGYMSGDIDFCRKTPMGPPEPIRMSWDEWKASRTAKRAALRSAGVDAASRRKNSYSTSDRRLRQAFGGERGPAC